jgi:hypothetical protein
VIKAISNQKMSIIVFGVFSFNMKKHYSELSQKAFCQIGFNNSEKGAMNLQSIPEW